MGVWGAGLYSGDFAMDLRSAVSAVMRLPLEGDEMVRALSETEPQAASDANNPDHTIFWLIVADQFSKRGIVSAEARDKALTMIDTGADIAAHQKLGMDAAGLKNRQKMLDGLRARISAPVVSAPKRAVLKKPQAFSMEVGDVLAYPTWGGKCVNPYYKSKEMEKQWTKEGPVYWKQDGWAAMVIVDRGRAFGFLTWYRPLTLTQATADKPTLEALRAGDVLWRLARTGTCSPVHFKRMEFEKIGALPIDPAKVRRVFPGMRPGTSHAISDISIANHLSVRPYTPAALMPRLGEPPNLSHGHRYATIQGIEEILVG